MIVELFGPPGPMHCPLHPDRNASAVRYLDGGFHCFRCDAHANSREDLVRQILFPEEPYWRGMLLARGVCEHEGKSLHSNGAAPAKKPGASPGAVLAMTTFADLAGKHLAERPDLVRQLQATRGLRDPLGCHLGLADRALLAQTHTRLREEGFDAEEAGIALQQAGLIKEEGVYRLGNRIIIPEVRADRAIYYQARATGAAQNKYLNPALPRPIFGLESLDRDSAFVVIGEGPFDVLPLIESGTSAVAVLGGSASLDEAALRSGFADRPVVVGFDADGPGLTRGQRLTEGLRELGIDAVHFPPPPPYKDYGEWIAAKGVRDVLAYIQWELP